MAAILLKNVPEALRQRLQERAKRNRRSMNQEALVILEQALPEPLDVKAIMAWEPIKLNKPIDWAKAVREARDERGQKVYDAWVGGKASMAADADVQAKRRVRRTKKA